MNARLLPIVLLALTAGHGARAARLRYASVRAATRAAIADWWARILPADKVAADARLPHRLAGVHLALVDGAFVAQQSGVGKPMPRKMSGLPAHARRSAVARKATSPVNPDAASCPHHRGLDNCTADKPSGTS